MVVDASNNNNNTANASDNNNNNNDKINVVNVEINKCNSAVSDNDIFRITTLLHPMPDKFELTNSTTSSNTKVDNLVNTNQNERNDDEANETWTQSNSSQAVLLSHSLQQQQ